MKLLILACLVAVCCSQPIAHIPETFTSTLEITRTRGSESETGRGSWDRNAEEMEFMYRDTFRSPAGKEETFEELGLYARKMRYSILTTGIPPNATSHCRPEKISESDEFPKVWEWVSDPNTKHEEKTINGTTYIVYFGHERDEMISLYVKPDEPTRPVMESRDGRMGKEETRFVTFEPMTPPSTVFEVPSSCRQPPPRKHHV